MLQSRVAFTRDIWSDWDFVSLTMREKLLWFWLLTNQRYASPIGINPIDTRVVAKDFPDEITPTQVQEALRKFQKLGWVAISEKTGEVAILSFLRHQFYSNGGKPALGIIRTAEREVKDPSLLDRMYEHLSHYNDNSHTVTEAIKQHLERGLEKTNREATRLLAEIERRPTGADRQEQ